VTFSQEAYNKKLVDMHSPSCFKENKYRLALAGSLHKENGVIHPVR